MEKFGFVYIWRDRKHKRYYIGAHWGSEDDGYICSSNWMKRSYQRRPEDFKRRILKSKISSKQHMFEEENKWLNLVKQHELGKKYYNLQNHWQHWTAGDPVKTEEIKNKISSKLIITFQNPMIRKKMSESAKKRGPSFLGKFHSAESKIKMRNAKIGNTNKKGSVLSPESKKRISNSKLGTTPWNKGVKTNIPPWNKGKTNVYSLETLLKMSAAKTGKKIMLN